MRIVLDTSVLVAGLRSSLGASHRLLRLIPQEKVDAAATPALFLEYEDVLKRPEHLLVHRLSLKQIEIFLADFATKIEPVNTYFQWRPQLKDANDEMVLEAAINGHADAIATFNERDFLPAAGDFGVELMRPIEIIRRLER